MTEQKIQLITPEQAAEMLCVSARTMRHLREKGTGPRWLRIGARIIRYDLADVKAYLNAKL